MLLSLALSRIKLNSKERTEIIKLKNQRHRNIKTKTQKEKKLSFPKEQVENVDLYKLVLNKTMTTCK